MKLFDVYPLYEVCPVKANDVHVYDEAGTEYLDLYTVVMRSFQWDTVIPIMSTDYKSNYKKLLFIPTP